MDVIQGSDFRLACTFTDKEGQIIDLTGGVARAVMKYNKTDADNDAVFLINSTDDPQYFDLSQANNGRVVARSAGSFTSNISVSEKRKVYMQVEVVVDEDKYYRSSVQEINLTKALFNN